MSDSYTAEKDARGATIWRKNGKKVAVKNVPEWAKTMMGVAAGTAEVISTSSQKTPKKSPPKRAQQMKKAPPVKTPPQKTPPMKTPPQKTPPKSPKKSPSKKSPSKKSPSKSQAIPTKEQLEARLQAYEAFAMKIMRFYTALNFEFGKSPAFKNNIAHLDTIVEELNKDLEKLE